MSDIGPEGRSFAPISIEDLRRLADLAHQDREAFFTAHDDWAELYRDRLLAVALCQGAAGHYLNGQRGVNDFDVYSFYATHPKRRWYAKRIKSCDFGNPKFGQSMTRPDYDGRKVDLLGRGIPYRQSEDPAEAIRRWLRTAQGSASLLAQQPIILLWPAERIGEVIWSPDWPLVVPKEKKHAGGPA